MKQNENRTECGSFAAILRRFEIAEAAAAAAADATAADASEYGAALIDTARAVCFAVLAKLTATGGQYKIIAALRRDVAAGSGEGADLISAAEVALLTEAAAARQRYGAKLPDNWTECPYEYRKIDKRVLIKAEDSAAWKTAEIAPISAVFQAVRRAVRDSASVRVASGQYVYFAELCSDPENDETAEEIVYRRLPKYATETDETAGSYTADKETVKRIAAAVAALKLTDKQNDVLTYRLRGYGIKAIATKCGVKHQSIAERLTQIQTKARAVGLTPKSSSNGGRDEGSAADVAAAAEARRQKTKRIAAAKRAAEAAEAARIAEQRIETEAATAAEAAEAAADARRAAAAAAEAAARQRQRIETEAAAAARRAANTAAAEAAAAADVAAAWTAARAFWTAAAAARRAEAAEAAAAATAAADVAAAWTEAQRIAAAVIAAEAAAAEAETEAEAARAAAATARAAAARAENTAAAATARAEAAAAKRRAEAAAARA